MRSFLVKALATAALVTWITGAQRRETVVWWDFLGGGDGIRMKKLIEDFNADQCRQDRDPGDDARLGRAVLHQGPDLGRGRRRSGPDDLPRLAHSAGASSQGTLAEITADDMAAMGLSRRQLRRRPPGKRCNVDGKQYAVPFDTHPIVLYYNKDKLAAAGLIGDDGLPTGLDGVDNFHAALKKLKDGGTEVRHLDRHAPTAASRSARSTRCSASRTARSAPTAHGSKATTTTSSPTPCRSSPTGSPTATTRPTPTIRRPSRCSPPVRRR